MGCAGSKTRKDEALLLCRARMRLINRAIDSRYALSAAQLAYTQSLRSIGIALRRFAEAEVSIESSMSTSEPDKSPSRSSYATGCSPLHNGSPLSPRLSNLSYMRAARSASVTVRVHSSSNRFSEEESLTFPPPPPQATGLPWDYFDSVENAGGFQNGEHGYNPNLSNSMGFRPLKEDGVVPFDGEEMQLEKVGSEGNKESSVCSVPHDKINAKSVIANPNSIDGITSENSQEAEQTQHGEMNKELCAEREDASEFITHRAKNFLSSVKDIEHRFLRAAEYGNEVSRMLEANKIRLNSCSEKRGRSSVSVFLSTLRLGCCDGGTVLGHEPAQYVTKVITWNRSTSSLSSSSKNPLAVASKDDICDSGSDFIEEFSMVFGSHSSTLDRLYAWERKLYDEVKASKSIRKVYDWKCSQLRHQFARDLNAQVIDKTRAVVKDLHSRVRVAIKAVDSVSKRIEKLRDEELQPQLVELIHGLIRMWKAMLECHHAQYITISLAYHVKSSTAASQSESYRQALIHLRNEIDFFGSNFANWVDSHKAYVEALSAWLQNCILQPQERSRRKKIAFSPRRALAPPIFVLCRDWLSGIKSLPSEELSEALKALLADLHDSLDQQQVEQNQTERKPEELENNRGLLSEEKGSNLGNLQASLTRMFDRLTKFAEASLKVFEDIKRGSETACVAYANGRVRFAPTL